MVAALEAVKPSGVGEVDTDALHSGWPMKMAWPELRLRQLRSGRRPHDVRRPGPGLRDAAG